MEAEHQEGAARFPPEVVERDDVRMLHPAPRDHTVDPPGVVLVDPGDHLVQPPIEQATKVRFAARRVPRSRHGLQ